MARHCPEVLRRAATPAEPETRFTETSEALCRALAARLSGLVGGTRLRATCTPIGLLAPPQLFAAVGPIAANSVLHFDASGSDMLVSLPLHDLLSFTDRVFGGDGAVPEALPEELPLTADLVAGQVEAVLAECFAAVLVPLPVPAVTARVPNLARLEPFAKLAQCCSFVLTVSEDAGPAWSIRLSIAPEAFAVLFAAKPRPVPTAAPRDPQAAPFAELPLELNAVVAEFSLPLARLSGLKCGDTIPLVLSREVPLKILETTIAYGSVGAADERAALQLTRVF